MENIQLNFSALIASDGCLMKMKNWLLILSICLPRIGEALELQGVITNKCRSVVGLPINVSGDTLTLMNLDGKAEEISRDSIDSVAIYNVIENPFSAMSIDTRALSHLKELYLDDNNKPDSMVFAVRFIEDLVIFTSLDGQTHVHSMKDIDRLRPANTKNLGVHRLNNSKRLKFMVTDSSERCPGLGGTTGASLDQTEENREVAAAPKRSANKVGKKADITTDAGDPNEAVRPTRILADKISIAELYDSFAKGYENLDSFQERTYLYAKPFLYPRSSRLGLVLASNREEAGINFPLYFQWSSGEAYRFQSFNVFGGKPNEFLPNAESVFAIRSDVKSHIFHGLFVGNIAGMPAGESLFLSKGTSTDTLKDQVTVQPSFNYLAMMGGDYGPYSLSVGFYFPTFGLKVGTQQREILGSSLTYAVRAMYTNRKIRLRAITSMTEYSRGQASEEDVISQVGSSTDPTPPTSFEFNALFLRPGIDYSFSDEFKASADLIVVDGTYKEIRAAVGNDIKFQRLTTQVSVQQSFGDYITLIGYLNLIRHDYKANFSGETVGNKNETETRYLGTLEFVF